MRICHLHVFGVFDHAPIAIDDENFQVFDHTIRCDTADDMKRAEDLSAVPEDAQYRPVALHVHGDYTNESAW